jgi:hypothetical protein
MRLESYSDFRYVLSFYELSYDMDLLKNTYVICNKKGEEIISLCARAVRNDFDSVKDDLVTAINVERLFGL